MKNQFKNFFIDNMNIIYNNRFMEIQSIDAIKPLDFCTVYKVLTSSKITDIQKERFVRNNQTQIEHILTNHITGAEYKQLMKSRPLQKFKPIKNSFTKRGDKILLSNALEIEPCEVDDYINEVSDEIQKIDGELGFLSKDKLDAIKTYVYRHGNAKGLAAFLDYNILKTLYSTLEYHTGGIADYFIRPVHRMTNKRLVTLYKVISNNIDKAEKEGKITSADSEKIAKWALVQIYKIQNNSKIINAIKTYNVLSQ